MQKRLRTDMILSSLSVMNHVKKYSVKNLFDIETSPLTGYRTAYSQKVRKALRYVTFLDLANSVTAWSMNFLRSDLRWLP